MATPTRRVDHPVSGGSAPARRKSAPTTTPAGGGSAARGKTTSKPTTMTTTFQQAQTWVNNASESTGEAVRRTGTRPTPTPSSGGPRMVQPGNYQARGPTTFLNQRVTWNGSQLQAPTSAPSPTLSSGSGFGATFNKATSARLILLAIGVGGVVIIVSSKNYPAYTSPQNGVTVPGTLHAFAGLTIAGTIALAVNEVLPDVGVVFAVGLVFLALNDAFGTKQHPGPLTTLGTAIFGKGTPSSSKSPFPSNPNYNPNPKYPMPPPQASLPGSSPGGYGSLSG